MKKRFLTLIFTITAMLLCIFGLSACGKVASKVNFVVDGEVYATLSTKGEEVIKMPENPTKDDYVFDGWYWDKDTWKTPFTANSLLDAPLSSDMNVYCKWKPKQEGSGEETKGEETNTGLLFKTLTVDGTNVSGKVSNATETFSFLEEVSAYGLSKFIVALDIYGAQQVVTKTIALNVGDNTAYIIETIDGEAVKVYTVTVRRRPTYTVSFDSNGGTAVQSQQVEEDSLATAPETTPERLGYTFEKWDYDFSQSVTDNLNITAEWQANTDTQYRVEYYLQNLANDYYTLQNSETENLTGTTDTTATAEIKTFPHFTYKTGSTESGNINGDGSTVLKVYYTRDTYTVTFDGNGGTRVSGSERQTVKYGGSVTAPEYVKTGYTFKFDKTNFTNISESFTATAIWTANTNTPYRVEYYLQNLQGDNYTLETTENKTGTTDTTTTAEIKTFPHFTYKAGSMESGNINGDGSTVLKVYYTRDTYTVTFDGNGGTLVSGSERQTVKYGGSVTAPEYVKTGYTFKFDKTNFTNISESFTVTAIWTINQYTLTIVYGNGQENKEIKQDYNTPIESIANPESRAGYDFAGWDKTIPITMPAENLIVTAKWNAIFTLSKGTVTGLTSYGKNNYTKLNIPSKIDGVTITAISYEAFAYCSSLTSVTIPDSVTSIGSYAFYDCSSLTSVTIPDSVTSIGDRAFEGCSSLQYNVKEHIKYLGNAKNPYVVVMGVTTSLTTYTIDNNAKIIYDCAFVYCSSLTSVTIPDGVTSIGFGAFGYCSGLTSVTIPDSVTSIGYAAFYYCDSLTSVTIGNSVTSIGYAAFVYCSSLRSITVDANNQYYQSIDGNLYTKDGTTFIQYAIGKTATSFEIPDSVTSIGDSAFSGCSSLTSITIPFVGATKDGTSNTHFGYIFGASSSSDNSSYVPSSLKTVVITGGTSIGSSAFRYCSGLTSVTIPDSVTSIGSSAFEDCSSLTSITIPFVGATKDGTSNTRFGYIFGASSSSDNSSYVPSSLKTVVITGGTSIGSSAFFNCNSLTSVNIPDSVTSIGDSAFKYCSSLTSIEIPNSVTSIGGAAFMGCINLTSVKIPNSVTSISSAAFYNCYDLTNLVIPDSVTSIGFNAFNGCSSLTSVTIPNSVTSIDNDAFSGCSSLTSVTIGNSVTSIGYYAFYNCSSLTRVYYTGTAEQWS